MEQGYAARIARITSGRSYQADGLVPGTRSGQRSRPLPWRHRPNVRFGALTLVSVVVTVLSVDPSVLPPEVQGMIRPAEIAAYADTLGLTQLIGMITAL